MLFYLYLPPPETFYWSSRGIYTPYLGPDTAAAIIADKAPLYKIGIAPALSKNPKLYKNPPKFID